MGGEDLSGWNSKVGMLTKKFEDRTASEKVSLSLQRPSIQTQQRKVHGTLAPPAGTRGRRESVGGNGRFPTQSDMKSDSAHGALHTRIRSDGNEEDAALFSTGVRASVSDEQFSLNSSLLDRDSGRIHSTRRGNSPVGAIVSVAETRE